MPAWSTLYCKRSFLHRLTSRYFFQWHQIWIYSGHTENYLGLEEYALNFLNTWNFRSKYVGKSKCVQNRPGAVARSEASSLGMQAAPSSILTSGTFFRGDLVMKTFLRPFSLFRWFKKCSCQLLAKECALSTGKLPSLARLTDRARNDLKCVEGP